MIGYLFMLDISLRFVALLALAIREWLRVQEEWKAENPS